MMVIGSMIGSGIFVVSADMARLLGSPGWLLTAWLLTGLLTVAGAVVYGELAGMFPHAGGQYVFLREAYSPLCGFLYGWTLFLVIQTGTIAAVGVAFARYAGAIFPWFSETNYLLPPLHLTDHYAVSLSTVQLTAIILIIALTLANMRGLHYGRVVQNLFTVAKTGALIALIALGFTLGWNSDVVHENLASFWTPRPSMAVAGELWSTSTAGMLIALGVAQVGSLFSADSWHVVAFAAEEVENPRRNLPLSMALGTLAVTGLYLLANFAYLTCLRFEQIQTAPADRVATAMVQQVFPSAGVVMMSAAIMISTLGCNNGLILAGARAYYAMARDGLFFRKVGELNAARTPAWGLAFQAAWSILLVLPRTYDSRTKSYGNLYGDLLDYVVSAALLFYIVTIAGLFRLRRTRPLAERPVRAWGYPWVPALYILGAGTIVAILVAYRPMTTWPGLVLVGLGVPVYLSWRRRPDFESR